MSTENMGVLSMPLLPLKYPVPEESRLKEKSPFLMSDGKSANVGRRMDYLSIGLEFLNSSNSRLRLLTQLASTSEMLRFMRERVPKQMIHRKNMTVVNTTTTSRFYLLAYIGFMADKLGAANAEMFMQEDIGLTTDLTVLVFDHAFSDDDGPTDIFVSDNPDEEVNIQLTLWSFLLCGFSANRVKDKDKRLLYILNRLLPNDPADVHIGAIVSSYYANQEHRENTDRFLN